MRVLIACEFSGIVRRAFRERGHDAWSCDLLPAEDNSEYHIQDDVRLHLPPFEQWDLLIAHPPCTYLCNSGVRWLYQEGKSSNLADIKRWKKMSDAADFFLYLWRRPIPHIAIENPVPHRYAKLPAFSQSIQPWQFGHGEVKRTCLWLKNLPKLEPTQIVEGRTPRVHHEPPSPDRWKNRSRTYQGFADAMANQWGTLT